MAVVAAATAVVAVVAMVHSLLQPLYVRPLLMFHQLIRVLLQRGCGWGALEALRLDAAVVAMEVAAAMAAVVLVAMWLAIWVPSSGVTDVHVLAALGEVASVGSMQAGISGGCRANEPGAPPDA